MNSRPTRVALSGGIASGKGRVCDYFSVLGVPIIDADRIARSLLLPGTVAYHKVLALFGSRFINHRNRQLQRDVLRAKISKDYRKRRQLEDLLHPVIRVQMEIAYQALEDTVAYCIFCIPLLVETGMQEAFDRVLIVDARFTVQLRRLVARDRCSHASAKRLMATQATRCSRLQIADDIITNNGSMQSLQRQVLLLHRVYRGHVSKR